MERNKAHHRIEAPFTLVEIMIVVVIIGLLASILGPSLQKARTEAHATRVANDLRVFSGGFVQYSFDHGGYPSDTDHSLPPGMAAYFDPDNWNREPFGGFYDWEGLDAYDYAGISLNGSTAPTYVMVRIDERIDDGDVNTGMFRRTDNGLYTYIIEE